VVGGGGGGGDGGGGNVGRVLAVAVAAAAAVAVEPRRARGAIIPDYYCLSTQAVLKFGDWFAVAWATDEEKEMVFAVKLPAHNNLANCSFRLGTHPHAQPSALARALPSPVHPPAATLSLTLPSALSPCARCHM
jgi:hypothetical protein